jgi:AcrR family transcriptional regulator
VRPTREETRQRLFAAAAAVFAERGVSGTTVEELTAAAGLTRGAFYSNYSTMEELAAAMLDDHLARSWIHNRALAAQHPDPADLVQALRDDNGRDDPLHMNPLLQVELMLFVARNADLRGGLGEHVRTMRTLVGGIAEAALRARGVTSPVPPEQLGTILVAVEDGLRLHRLIDPDSTPADAFLDALDALQQLATGSPSDDRRRGESSRPSVSPSGAARPG